MKPTFMKKDAQMKKMMDETKKGIMVHRHTRMTEKSSKATMNKGSASFPTNTPMGMMSDTDADNM